MTDFILAVALFDPCLDFELRFSITPAQIQDAIALQNLTLERIKDRHACCWPHQRDVYQAMSRDIEARREVYSMMAYAMDRQEGDGTRICYLGRIRAAIGERAWHHGQLPDPAPAADLWP